MSEASDRNPTNGRFVNGTKAGPGRPRGARSRFSERFLEDLATSWDQFGVEALRRVAVEEPSQFLRCCAMLMPRDLAVSMSVTHDVGTFTRTFREALTLLGNTPERPRPRRPLRGEPVVVIEHRDVAKS